MPASNLTLVATFKANTYKLHFNNDGVINSVDVNFDSLVVEPELPIKAGYRFIGWSEEEKNGKQWDFTTDKMPASDKTLYAQYIKTPEVLPINPDNTPENPPINPDNTTTDKPTPGQTSERILKTGQILPTALLFLTIAILILLTLVCKKQLTKK
ncbi:MAG: InlB B-repeat-containing protein [Mycoplasmatales bacterium]